MRRLLLPGLVIAFALAIALVPTAAMGVSIPAAPYTSANDCLACHQAGNNGPVVHTVDFTVPAVDKSRCNVCHYAIAPNASGVPNHPSHYAGGDCASCHNSWPLSTGITMPWKQTFNAGAAGWFSNADSVNADAATLHAIHGRRSWPADITSRALGCGKCHGVVSCDACHGPIPHDAHPTQNGNPAPAAPTVNPSPVPAGTFPPDYWTTISCAAADCHAGIGSERIVEDADAAVSAGAGWTSFVMSDFLGGSALRAGAPGAELTVTFTGSQVSIWGVTGVDEGAIQVYIDGAFAGVKDLYESGSHFRDGVWMSGDLGAGSHTLRIVTATSPKGGGNEVWFDRIVARDLVAPADQTPQCTTCHDDKAGEHGYGTADHVADESSTAAPELGGKTCAECHSMDLSTAHAAVSVANPGGDPITGCSICHSVLPQSAGTTMTAEGSINPDHVPTTPSRWNQTCEACHNANNPVVAADKHQNMANHTLSGDTLTNNQKCFTCHPLGDPRVVDLPTMHTTASVTVTISGTPTLLSGCDVCHKNPDVPRPGGRLSNDCSTCHFTFDDHPKDHTSRYNLSSCNNAGCHTAAEAVDPSTQTSVTVSDLVTIHNEKATGGVFDCNNCHQSTDTKVANAIATGNTDCDACHTLGAGGGQNDPHYILHWANPPLADGSNPVTPHYAYVTGSAPGGTYTTDCLGCHTSNLVDEHLGVQNTNGSWSRPPRHTGDGQSLTCATCHSGSLDVQTAILDGKTNCDACHVVHKQISQQHATNFKPTPEVACTDCHSADLSAIHDAGLVATTGNGTTLQGCAVCHDYTTNLDSADDTMGARVQAAIATGDQNNYCTACHLGYHQSATTKHVAATSASTDGCGMCHDDADTSGGIDVTVMHDGVTAPGPCTVCHNNKGRVPDITQKTAECASCHSMQGTDYHRGYAAKHLAPSPADCFTCHKTNDALALHADRAEGECAVCHANPTKGDLTAGKTSTACDGCHTTEGTDFHKDKTARHASPTNDTCFGTGCHAASKSLPDVHALYVGAGSDNPDYATTCDLCHMNEDPDRIDWTTANADCATCHGIATHQGKTGAHSLTTASDDCVGCHGTSGIDAIHKADPNAGGTFDNCATCHNNPARGGDVAAGKTNADCKQCHITAGSDYHESQDASHTFTAMPTGCTQSGCHPSNKLPDVHDPYVGTGHTYSQYATSCALCHQNADSSRIDWSKASADCSTCHDPVDPGTPHTGVHVLTSVSNGCVSCHAIPSGGDAATLHKDRVEGKCAVCHANPTKGDLTAGKSAADCAGCHDGYDATTGSGHSGLPGDHQSPTITSSCQGGGCHSADLPTTHDPYDTKNGFATSCEMCHKNPTRIPDITLKTAACDSCHIVGSAGHIGVHVATDTVTTGCEACHKVPSGGDVASLHAGATYGPCNTCHNNPDKGDLTMSGGVRKPNAACAQSGCHSAKNPYDPNHYPSTPHAAIDSLTVDPSLGTACGQCHYMDLKGEHVTKTTSTMTDGTAITCAKCHDSSKFLALPSNDTSIGKTWSPKACAGCHSTKHADMATKHDFSAIRPECAGSGCHATGNVGTLHANASVTVGGSTLTGCAVCHQSPTTVPARDCMTCHTSATPGHTTEHVTTGVDAGCAGCHFSDNLVKEHITSGLKGTNGLALTCDSCHGSDNASVKNAISTGDTSCDACHPAVNGKNRHQNQWTNEFVSSNSSMHRVNSDLPGMRSSFVVNGTTYTWTLPGSSSGGSWGGSWGGSSGSDWLKSPWTTDSVVTCNGCHNFGTAPAGPHGASVAVNIDPAYTTAWRSATLRSPGTVICTKCHQNFGSMNGTHSESDHDEYLCTDCHSGVPHGWKLPRLLAYTTDPVPYKSNHLTSIKLKNYSANNWSESDCGQSGCDEHNGSVSPKWPSAGQVVASVNGRVMDSANATGVAGAVVTLKSGTTTPTNRAGYYSFTNVAAGTYTVSVTATGFVGQSTTVVIAQSDDYFADFNLLRQGTLAGVVTDSADSSPLEGVTVTMNGMPKTTGADGKFDFGPLAAGSYSVSYSLPGYAGQTKTFTVADGVATDAGVALVKIQSGTVSGTITDAGTGDPIPGASVSLGSGLTDTTDANGDYTIANVVYGDYTLTVSAATYDSASVAVAVNAANVTKDVTLSKPSSVNIAQGKPATASNTAYGSSAGNAFDGNATTYWNSGSVSSSARWLRVDLGLSPEVYNKFVINWYGSYYARNVQVQTSNDGTTWTTVASTTSGTGGSAQTFTLADGTDARYVRLYLSSYNTSGGYRVNEFQVWSGGTLPPPPPVSVNVAKGKSFTASSQYSSSYPASRAGDGSYSSYWQSHSLSYSNATEWLRVDLGAATTIDQIVVGWNGTSYYARSYQVQTSLDGSNWTTVYSTSSGTSSSKTITFAAREARYVRVYMTGYNSSNGYRIYELEAWTP